jgi:hypothetical protein
MDPIRPVPEAEDLLLRELAHAVDGSSRPIESIEVGIPLSSALGRHRPAVACGGCSTPLEFRGIPATTNARLTAPFRLVYRDGPGERS